MINGIHNPVASPMGGELAPTASYDRGKVPQDALAAVGVLGGEIPTNYATGNGINTSVADEIATHEPETTVNQNVLSNPVDSLRDGLAEIIDRNEDPQIEDRICSLVESLVYTIHDPELLEDLVESLVHTVSLRRIDEEAFHHDITFLIEDRFKGRITWRRSIDDFNAEFGQVQANLEAGTAEPIETLGRLASSSSPTPPSSAASSKITDDLQHINQGDGYTRRIRGDVLNITSRAERKYATEDAFAELNAQVDYDLLFCADSRSEVADNMLKALWSLEDSGDTSLRTEILAYKIAEYFRDLAGEESVLYRQILKYYDSISRRVAEANFTTPIKEVANW